VQRRTKAALLTALILIATQPLALSFLLPLFVLLYLRTPSHAIQSDSPDQPLSATHGPLVIRRWSFLSVGISAAIGTIGYVLVCILSGSWDEPRRITTLFAALDILVAAGFALIAPNLDWLAPPTGDRRALKTGLLTLGLAALALWQGSVLVQDWRFRPTDRLAVYETLGQWIQDHTLPVETIAAQQAGWVGYLSHRAAAPLPDTSHPHALVAELDDRRPDYCVALNTLAWRGVRAQPWFQAHYEEIHQLASPYDATTPLTVFRYAPTPFDEGEISGTKAAFAFDTGEQIELRGYRLGSRRVTPGEPLYLTLFWHAETPLPQPLLLTVRLIDLATGRVWAKVESAAPGGLATDLWNAGTRLDDRLTLSPPADIPPGDYVLDMAFYLPNGRPLPVRVGRGGAGQTAATRLVLVRISRPPSVSTAPLAPDHPFSATFGSEIELMGYDVAERVAPGETLRVALYWHARGPVPVDYKVFVHLLGSEGEQIPIAQDDSLPVGWTYPTTRWRPGETIRDEHLLAIPSSAPRGDYWLVVGLYDSDTGERPPVRDSTGGDVAERRVTLQPIQVR
jgi:hypothetical protein